MFKKSIMLLLALLAISILVFGCKAQGEGYERTHFLASICYLLIVTIMIDRVSFVNTQKLRTSSKEEIASMTIIDFVKKLFLISFTLILFYQLYLTFKLFPIKPVFTYSCLLFSIAIYSYNLVTICFNKTAQEIGLKQKIFELENQKSKGLIPLIENLFRTIVPFILTVYASVILVSAALNAIIPGFSEKIFFPFSLSTEKNVWFFICFFLLAYSVATKKTFAYAYSKDKRNPLIDVYLDIKRIKDTINRYSDKPAELAELEKMVLKEAEKAEKTNNVTKLKAAFNLLEEYGVHTRNENGEKSVSELAKQELAKIKSGTAVKRWNNAVKEADKEKNRLKKEKKRVKKEMIELLED